MATYEELELDSEIINLIEEKSSEPGFAEFITPEGLLAWINAGGDLAKAVHGIGPKSVKKVMAALDKLDPATPEETVTEPPAEVIPAVKPSEPEIEVTLKPVTEPLATEPPVQVENPKPKDDEPEVKYVTIRLPIGPRQTNGYDAKQAASGVISLSDSNRATGLSMKLTPELAEAALMIRNGLRLTHAIRPDIPKPAWETPDVVRCVLGQVVAEISKSES